jgi:hypothetical protein
MKLSSLSILDKKELLNEIKNMNFKYRDTLNFSKNITFGVEIEYGNSRRKDIMNVMENYGGEKIDPFYRNWTYGLEVPFTLVENGEYYGGELISPILKNNKKYLEQLKLACETLKKYNATINEKMAQHVHVSDKKIKSNLKYFENFLKIYALYEDIIYSFGFYGGDPREVIKIYSSPLSHIIYTILNEKKYDDIEKLKSIFNIHFGKSSSINHEDTTKSFEFRMCNGTIDPVIIQNNVNLFCSLIDASKNRKLDVDFIDYELEKFKDGKYSTEKVKKDVDRAIEFSDIIFKKDIDKKYFLKQYIM